MSHLVGPPQGQQHVAGVQGAGGTGAAGGGGDALSSSSNSRDSPSIPSKHTFTFPGSRAESPFSAVWGMAVRPAISLSRRGVR